VEKSFNDHFIVDLLLNAPVKEFRKSINIRRSYGWLALSNHAVISGLENCFKKVSF